ncbi:MAG: hypothetical protein H6962_08740 [Chromatiaceae bacterium]|nr:hypothetical protein [Chromatiaceae bacterium]
MARHLGLGQACKDAAAIEAELANGQFMDLLRWNADGKVENGYVLDQRVMVGGAAVEAQGWLEAGIWTVEMKRPLKPGKPGDLDIEAGKVYNSASRSMTTTAMPVSTMSRWATSWRWTTPRPRSTPCRYRSRHRLPALQPRRPQRRPLWPLQRRLAVPMSTMVSTGRRPASA